LRFSSRVSRSSSSERVAHDISEAVVRPWRWLAAIILVAVNLRPAIASVPPLADAIAADLRLSATALGVLTTLPVLCMGLFAPAGAIAARRFGTDRVLAASVALIAVGTALRVFSSLIPLYCATALAGVGIAVVGALLPPLVRARFPDRVGPVTGLYTAGLIGGALLAASLTAVLPYRWSVSLSLWSLPASVALAAWLFLVPPVPFVRRPAAPAPWRSSRAWYATIFMGGQSLLYYAALAWLAARYTAIGDSQAHAGLLLGLFSGTQLVSSLGMPLLAHRFGDLRPWIVLSLTLTGVCLALVAFAPNPLGWLWVSILGLGVGGQFALALTVLSGLGGTAAESAAATGMALFVGYLLAAAGPVLAGALRDSTGGYTVPFAALAAFSVPVLLAGVRSCGSSTEVDSVRT
jgi:CP family cyanate transporter-like MFS transporter